MDNSSVSTYQVEEDLTGYKQVLIHSSVANNPNRLDMTDAILTQIASILLIGITIACLVYRYSDLTAPVLLETTIAHCSLSMKVIDSC